MKIRLAFTVALVAFAFSTIQAADGGDNSRYFKKSYIEKAMLRAANWQIVHPKHAQTDWTNGAFYAGVYAAWQTTGKKNLWKAMMTIGNDSTHWNLGKRWYHADDLCMIQTYADLYRKEKKPEMIEVAKDYLNKFISDPYPRSSKIDVIKWWWCDALFMAPPALVKMGMITGNGAYLTYSDHCFRECYDLLYNQKEHLFARDLSYVIKGNSSDKYEANGQKIFWGRGNGWVMGGLARILGELPADYSQRAFYEGLFREMSDRLAELQQSDGLWRASLLDPASYPGGEVSGSGFICYALAYGVNSGLLNKAKFLPIIHKAWIGLNQCICADGHVGWVQPVGADPRKNFSADSWEVYGTGAYLLAGSEVIKLINLKVKGLKFE